MAHVRLGKPAQHEVVERKLTAILAADVVGYSRLMAGDEAGIHARLRVLRKDFIEPAIAARHGRIVKLLGAGALAEFAATSLSATEVDARTLYGKVYCARGEVQSRIKEQQLDLFADRTSAATMGATQLRLWFASFGDVLIGVLRRIGLRFT